MTVLSFLYLRGLRGEELARAGSRRFRATKFCRWTAGRRAEKRGDAVETGGGSWMVFPFT